MQSRSIAVVYGVDELIRLPAVKAAHAKLQAALSEAEDIHRSWSQSMPAAGRFSAADIAMGNVMTTAEDYGRVETFAALERAPLYQLARRAVVFAAAALGLALGVLAGVTVTRR